MNNFLLALKKKRWSCKSSGTGNSFNTYVLAKPNADTEDLWKKVSDIFHCTTPEYFICHCEMQQYNVKY